jgi:A/G-specific adenine glycosylase
VNQTPAFFAELVAWQRQHGRTGLPWQGTRDPYRVWLSEIMLQQTQVATVLGYYTRFLNRFPSVEALAQAPSDDVMALWSGLGYYSRARNLQACAQQVVGRWGGRFPATAAQLVTLPGIGPSTAAAIAAFCFGERISIMDGNVKRVLSRVLAFGGDLADARQERALGGLAQALLPDRPSHDDMVAYTQGLMDLGASLCSKSRPQCLLCPAQHLCEAHRLQTATDFPVKTKKLTRKTAVWWLCVLRTPNGSIWLEKRPARGIWAGLYSLPVFDSLPALQDKVGTLLGRSAVLGQHPVIRHSLTHRDLVLHPVEVQLEAHEMGVLTPTNPGEGVWVGQVADLTMGLPAPLKVWLAQTLKE